MIDLDVLRMPVHIALHVLVPFAFAVVIAKRSQTNFLKVFCLLLAGMIIDLDHLLADPIFDPERCSIGFHPLHAWPAIAVYVLLLLLPLPTWTRLLAIGLLIHIALDSTDCLLMMRG